MLFIFIYDKSTLNSKANPPTLVGGGVGGRRPHTKHIPPAKLVVEWRDEKALPKNTAHRLRSEVSFRVLSKVSVQGDGREDQEAVARDDQRGVQRIGYRDRAGENNGRSRARVFIGASEVFSGRSNETSQRKKFRENFSRISGTQEALLGAAFLGTRIFREYGWNGRRDDQKIHQRTEQGRQSAETLELIGSHRRSRWSFTSPTENSKEP